MQLQSPSVLLLKNLPNHFRPLQGHLKLQSGHMRAWLRSSGWMQEPLRGFADLAMEMGQVVKFQVSGSHCLHLVKKSIPPSPKICLIFLYMTNRGRWLWFPHLVLSPTVFFPEYLPACIYFASNFLFVTFVKQVKWHKIESFFEKLTCFFFYHISFGKDIYIHYVVTQNWANKWTTIHHNKHLSWECSFCHETTLYSLVSI